jgi:hypothetical protein
MKKQTILYKKQKNQSSGTGSFVGLRSKGVLGIEIILSRLSGG